MDCPSVTSLEQAQAEMPSSVLPIKGLRRDNDGNLTADALQTIVDGLKSRGIDPNSSDSKKSIIKELVTLLCSVKKQYDFLLDEIGRHLDAAKPVDKKIMELTLHKNIFLQDILNVARHIDSLQVVGGSTTFIEGWQNTLPAGGAGEPSPMPPAARKMLEGFQADRRMLESGSYVEMRKHRLELLKEKNKTATNYLGIYGFMNLVAVGLLIYIAAAGSS